MGKQPMKLRDYRKDLIEKLKDPDYAAQYLGQVLAEQDRAAFICTSSQVLDYHWSG